MSVKEVSLLFCTHLNRCSKNGKCYTQGPDMPEFCECFLGYTGITCDEQEDYNPQEFIDQVTEELEEEIKGFHGRAEEVENSIQEFKTNLQQLNEIAKTSTIEGPTLEFIEYDVPVKKIGHTCSCDFNFLICAMALGGIVMLLLMMVLLIKRETRKQKTEKGCITDI